MSKRKQPAAFRIARDGDLPDGPSDATDNTKLLELSEDFEDRLHDVSVSLSTLRNATLTATQGVRQLRDLVAIAVEVMRVISPLLDATVAEARSSGTPGQKALAENLSGVFRNNLVPFLRDLPEQFSGAADLLDLLDPPENS